MSKESIHRFISILFAISLSFTASGQQKWQKNGVKIPSPICYGSGQSHKHYTPPPDEYLKQLKSTSHLKANIEVEYVGFSDEAKEAFQKAVDIWESLIYSPVPIHLTAFWTSLEKEVLGSCGPFLYYENFDAAHYKDCYYPVALAEKMEGREITGSAIPDMIAQFNKDNDNWYFGTDGNTPANKYDFVSIVLHEIAHGLGFTGLFYEQFGHGTYGEEFDFPGVFDEFVIDGQEEYLTDTSKYHNHSEELYDALTSNALRHASPSAKAVSEFNRFPRLYAPSPFDDGSSIYHLNESSYPDGDINSLMTPFIDRESANHNPGPLTLGMFADMGWKFISIKHDEIKDRETLDEAIPVEASVFSDSELDSTSVKMIYTRTDFETGGTVLHLTYDQTTDKFSVDFTDLEAGQIKYYLEATDVDGLTYRSPGIAPEKYYDFNLGPDTIKPVITHNPIRSILESDLNAEIVVEVEDNIGVEKVEVEYSVNNGNLQTLMLSLDSANVYGGTFAFSGLTDGDSILYRIKATDNTSNSNIGYLPQDGYFTIYIDGTFEPISEYFNNFNSFSRDFIISEFFIGTEPGFDDGALHSPHPYPSPDQDEITFDFTALLKYPITIKNGGVVTFKEVVLVEPGELNAAYGDEEFWDYVVIEGSKNGIDQWEPLLDGYDSRENESWLQLYNGTITGNNSSAMGNKNLFVQKKFYLDKNGFFDVGETIFIRFRIFSDPYAHGWGWAIDDLSIQDPLTSAKTLDYSPGEIIVFPNPLKSQLNIQANFDTVVGQIELNLLNSTGKPVNQTKVAVNGKSLNKTLDIDSLPSGLYLLVLNFENGQTITRKLIKE